MALAGRASTRSAVVSAGVRTAVRATFSTTATPTVHVPLSGEHMQLRKNVRSMGIQYADYSRANAGQPSSFLADSRRQRLRAAALPPQTGNPLDEVTEPLSYDFPKGSREGTGNDYMVNWQLSGGHRVCPAGPALRNAHPRALLQFSDDTADVVSAGSRKTLQERSFQAHGDVPAWEPSPAEMDDAKVVFGQVTDFLSQRTGTTFVHDGAVGCSPSDGAEIKVRVVSDSAAHAQFLRNMLPQTKLGKWATEWSHDLVVYDASTMAGGPRAVYVKEKNILMLVGVRSTAALLNALVQVAADRAGDVPFVRADVVEAGSGTAAVFGLSAAGRAAFSESSQLYSCHGAFVAGSRLTRAFAGVTGLPAAPQFDDLVDAEGQTVTRGLGTRVPNSFDVGTPVVVVEGSAVAAFSAKPEDFGLDGKVWGASGFVVTAPTGAAGGDIRDAIQAAVQGGKGKAATKELLSAAQQVVA
jgi:hypothetical protein